MHVLVTKTSKSRSLGLMLLVIAATIGIACGGGGKDPPTPTTIPQPTAETSPTPTDTAVPRPSPEASPTDTTTPGTLPLTLLAPRDGAGVEAGAVTILGKTRQDAVVGVNGIPVDVRADGSFTYGLILEKGANVIEVVATDLFDHTAFESRVVFSISPTAGLPFSLFYPPDGLVVSEPTISILGGSSPDAVVGINGIPVDIDALGLFSETFSLEEGPNFFEVVAADFQDNLRFQTVVVFYVP